MWTINRIVFASVCVLLAAPHVAVAQNATIEPAGGLSETLLLQEVNQQRANSGKPPLKLDDRISALARDIIGKFTSGEIPANSASIRGQRAVQRAAAITQIFGNETKIEENFQPTGTPNSVTRTWMSHENERNRMLDDFTLAGIGIPADRQGNINYGMIFVAPGKASPPSNPTPPIPPTVNNSLISHTLEPSLLRPRSKGATARTSRPLEHDRSCHGT